MARIIPPDYNAPSANFCYASERQTLDDLAESLPDSYTVFSSVLWAKSDNQLTKYGEIDFCVVSNAGQLIIIEQKSGGMVVRDGLLFKRYGMVEKDAGKQLLRTVGAFKEKWQQQHKKKSTVAIDYLLYLPDFKLKEHKGLQLDASRIVHAGRPQSLAEIILKICDNAIPNPDLEQTMHNFLTGVLQLELDIGRLQQHQERLYRRYEDSLLAWVKRLHFTPYVLRINGCAGSGKTQVAIGLLNEALANHENAKYICFNRPLADNLANVVPQANTVLTKDSFYHRFIQAEQLQPLQGQPSLQENPNYQQAENLVAVAPIPEQWLLDLLIIDEGQDFTPASFAVLKRFLKPNGRLVWLDDPEQNLYKRDAVQLEHAVTLTLDQCFRSPASIVKYLNVLFPLPRLLIAANPNQGIDPEFIRVDAHSLQEQLQQHLTQLIQQQGVKPADIAIISLHSLEKTALKGIDYIGDYSISRFDGTYSSDGKQQWTTGDILFDTIYRFKGSQRPFILLVDADFSVIDTHITRLFYCGMTRATVAVNLFLTADCERALMEQL